MIPKRMYLHKCLRCGESFQDEYPKTFFCIACRCVGGMVKEPDFLREFRR